MTVKLTSPWTAFPAILAGVDGVMISPTTTKGGKSIARNPVGTGPYRFKEWLPGQQVTVDAFAGYWGDQKAQVGSLVFKFVPVEASRWRPSMPARSMPTRPSFRGRRGQGEGQAQVAAPPATGYGLFMINNASAPLDDVRVRQALDMGWDRDAVAQAYGGQGYADYSSSPFVKGADWWSPPATPPKFDPARARALLADYGKPVKFTVLRLKGSQQIEDSVRAVVEYWKQLGADVNLDVVADISSYINSVITGNYDIAGWLAGSLSDPDIVLYNQFHTGGSSNYMKYSSPALDAALTRGGWPPTRPSARGPTPPRRRRCGPRCPSSITSHGQIFIVGSKKLTGLDPSYFFPSRTVGLAH